MTQGTSTQACNLIIIDGSIQTSGPATAGKRKDICVGPLKTLGHLNTIIYTPILSSELLQNIDLWLIDEPRKVAKLQINYAKKAKQVDVSGVKRGIWLHLTDSDRTVAVPPRTMRKRYERIARVLCFITLYSGLGQIGKPFVCTAGK